MMRRRIEICAALWLFLATLWLPGAARAVCAGDCNRDNDVTVDEIVRALNISLDFAPMQDCALADPNGDSEVSVEELIMAVNVSLKGCQCIGEARPFSGTWDAIQRVVLEPHGCTQQICHGAARQGGLDLSPAVAYENLIEVPSAASALDRIEPGDNDRSFFWLKLAKSTNPGLIPPGTEVPGAPMPNNLPPISEAELEAIRLWIYAGAPEKGTVPGTEALLNACLPKPEPLDIKPLDPPEPGKGIQLRMPEWVLEAESEHEKCFATYYDISDQVPPEYRDPSGRMFRFSSQELRQRPQSHHLILYRYNGPTADIHDPSFGPWTCRGGEREGEGCEPTDLSSCGEGICTSAIRESFACIGFGPGAGFNRSAIGGAQQAQAYSKFAEGVFAQIPMKGILMWNSHAFNLTDRDTRMHGRINYYFSDDPRFPVRGIFDVSMIFAASAPPYTTELLCNDYVLPQGARLFNLSSHTHKRGKHFTVTLPSGDLLYESFVYNDPLDLNLDPPLLFDSPDPAQRTLHFCSLYNNGVAPDGSPDPETVTRLSRMPESARAAGTICIPTACAAGRIGAPCSGATDNATCDTTPGAGDGLCDACRITGGESTENEMFILIGSFYIDDSGAAGGNGLDANGRSTYTEIALPPHLGSPSSADAHAGHGEHAGH